MTYESNSNPHYVTPEEAKEMDCINKTKDEFWCSGPKCMAWRWVEINDPQLKEGQWDDSTSEGWFTLGWKKQYSETHGYCGMVRHG